jgi:uncharacterized membrane protein
MSIVPFEGSGLGVAVMVVLLAAFLYSVVLAVLAALGKPVPVLPAWTEYAIPVLAIVGLGVAGYLTFVETQNVAAVCGPVGDCNTVQSSPYARLFGVLPVGVLGLAGYVAILAAWAVGRYSRGSLAGYAPLLLFAMALFGVLFSIYLTYLELAVILAVCAWCLTSAMIMALLLVLCTGPALGSLTGDEESVEM